MRAAMTTAMAGPQLQALGHAYVELCKLDLRTHPGPPLYASGVRYQREPRGREWWQLPSETRREKSGDCEDLAGYRVAELQLSGEPAKLLLRRISGGLWHAMVKRGDGSIEDPSKRLGMKGAA